MSIEYEVKLAGRREDLVAALESVGAAPTGARTLEDDVLLDTPERELGASGRLLRLRRRGDRFLLTLKGPRLAGTRVKARRETQTEIEDGEALLALLRGLGFDVVLRYQKYRTFFTCGAGPCAGVALTLDETPVGDFLEVEADPEAIDACVAALGFEPAAYETRSYLEIHRDLGRTGDMVFEGSATGSTTTRDDTA